MLPLNTLVFLITVTVLFDLVTLASTNPDSLVSDISSLIHNE